VLSSILIAAVISCQVEKAPRLKAVLPNGAMVLCQNVPSAKKLSIHLIVSTNGSPESPAQHGMRHLLEHLVARGKAGRLDAKLERRGAILTAQTTRDALIFTVECRPETLSESLEGLGEVLALQTYSQEAIDLEVKTISQELALALPETSVYADAWRVAFGDFGLDSLGNPEQLKAATPESLLAIHRDLFRASQMILVLSGPYDVDLLMAQAKPVLAKLPTTVTGPYVAWPQGKPGETVNETGYGECRGAIVTGMGEKSTLAVVAAGLILRESIPDWRLVYSPSVMPGLVLLRAPRRSEMAPVIDGMNDEQRSRNLSQVRHLLNLWIDSMDRDGLLRGKLLRQHPNLTPEKLRELSQELTTEDFRRGLEAYKTGNAVVVVGK